MIPRERLNNIITELEQSIVDTEWYNNNRLGPGDPPLDAVPDRTLLAKARDCLRALDNCDETEYARLCAELNQASESLWPTKGGAR
ncbi:MAG: hypothetical protein MI923_21500 [Phycisphaerales bacterium]|nr:hypothetical protein [Phycisphaerales bacterium]